MYTTLEPLRRRSAIATHPVLLQSNRESPRRVLIVVDDACTSPDLCASVRAATSNEPIEALVIAPAHGSAATQWYVDEDAARAEATHRLSACAACLTRDGIHTQVQVADPDPVQAIADALHDFPADEILLVTRPQHPSTWLRQNVIDRVRRNFQHPIAHIVMPRTLVSRPAPRRDPPQDTRTTVVRRASPHAEPNEGERKDAKSKSSHI